MRRTSASPFLPISRASPVPLSMGLTLYPVFSSKMGMSSSSKPVSTVLVVVARMTSFFAAACSCCSPQPAAKARMEQRNRKRMPVDNLLFGFIIIQTPFFSGVFSSIIPFLLLLFAGNAVL